MNHMPNITSPLRYPGGKSKFYPYVKRLIYLNGLNGHTYMEPFAGGAGLAIKLLANGDVKRIIINDFDPAIYSCWYSFLNYTDEFCELLERTDISPTEWKKHKDIYTKCDMSDKFSLGFSTYYLNRTNISGIIKGGIIGGINQKGTYKMSARLKKDKLCERIRNIAEYKNNIVLLNYDAKDLLSKHNLRKYRNVFINCDPPYVKKGHQLYNNSFCENDHRELAKLMSLCTRKWVVTYDICPLISELYSKYRTSYLNVNYSVHNVRKSKEYIFFSENMILPEDLTNK